MKKENFSNKSIVLSNENDHVGNRIYVDFLYKKINELLSNKEVETVALYGDWGIGKTSIIKTVQEKFNNENKCIMCKDKVIFKLYNAWKYSLEDFRKSFIINLDYSKKKEVYATTTDTEYKFKYKKIFNIIIIIIMFLTGVYLVYKFCTTNELKEKILDVFFAIISEYIISKTALSFFTEETSSKQNVYSSEEFSDLFKKILNEKYDNKNIVFVIDDLDRCTYQNTVDILECINGFMKEKGDTNANYLFLIPIDKNRLRRALSEERNYNDREQDKYLDKMFDFSINIDVAGDYNLLDMAVKRRSVYNIPISSKSIELLSSYYIETPRDVNMVLDKINNEIEIQKNKFELWSSERSVNDAELVKLFIIRNKWPIIYNYLLNYSNINKIDEEIKNIPGDKPPFDNISDFDEFLQFVRVSKSISIKNIRYYHYLKTNDICYDKELSSLYLSGEVENINNTYDENVLLDTFEKIYRDRNKDVTLMNERISNLLKSYMYLLKIINNKDDLTNRVSMEEICGLYFENINTNYEFENRAVFMEEIKEIFKEILPMEDKMIMEFVNIFIKKTIENVEDSNIIYMALLNEKEHNLLDKDNIRDCLDLSLKRSDISEGSLNFIFENVDKYSYLYNEQLWRTLLEKYLYNYLLTLSKVDTFDSANDFPNVFKTMLLDSSIKNNSISNLSSDKLKMLNDELTIISNVLSKANKDIQEVIKDFIPTKFINYIIDIFYSDFNKYNIISDGLVNLVTKYDNTFDNTNQLNVYHAIRKYSSYNNVKYVDFLIALLKNIENLNIKYDALMASFDVTKFIKAISQYFIDCFNKNENENYYKFVKIIENEKKDFDFKHAPFGGVHSTLSWTSYINNLRPLYVDLEYSVFEKIVPYLPLDVIFLHKTYMKNIDRLDIKVLEIIFSKTTKLDELLMLRNVIEIKDDEKNELLCFTLTRILIANKELYKGKDILNRFTTDKEQEVISRIYS